MPDPDPYRLRVEILEEFAECQRWGPVAWVEFGEEQSSAYVSAVNVAFNHDFEEHPFEVIWMVAPNQGEYEKEVDRIRAEIAKIMRISGGVEVAPLRRASSRREIELSMRMPVP